jgi:outer membrane protein insertion porin family
LSGVLPGKTKRKGTMFIRRNRSHNLKIYVFLISVLLANSAAVYAEKISEIDVKGNVNVKTKEIKRKVNTRKGETYSEEKLRSDITNILSLGYFNNVSIEVDTATYKVTFVVKEKPLIKTIKFKGNKKFTDRRLKGKIDLKEKGYFDETGIIEEKDKLVEFYKNEGYASADVQYDNIVDEKTSQAVITFIVNEGQKVMVNRLDIPGVSPALKKKVLGKLKTKLNKKYNEETLKNDVEEIRNFYKSRGNEAAAVSEPAITYNAKGDLMGITIKINEGCRYKVGSIVFSGNTIYGKSELEKATVLKSKRYYNSDQLTESLQALGSLYAEKGYIKAKIVPDLIRHEDSGTLDLEFKIEENNLVYVDRIYIDGLTYTKEYVVRRELMIKEGEPLAGSKLQRSMQKLNNLGFLDDVNVDFEQTGDPDMVDLLFTATEGKPGMISAGFGYSSVDRLVGTLQLTHMNLFGRGQKLNLQWENGQRKQSYQISWTEPWLLGKPMSFGVSAYNLTQTQAQGIVSSAYNEHRQGGNLNIGPRITDFLSLLFTYTNEVVSVSTISSVSTVDLPSKPQLTSSITGKVVYDSRDNIFDATKGNRQTFSIELAGGPFGGDVHFYKPAASTSWFFPTFWKFTFSVNASIGLVKALKDVVPVYERFLLGGPDTIRGYAYRGVGPLDEAGEAMALCNFEYKFPIAQEKGHTILQGAIFYDMGGAWKNANDINLRVGETSDWTVDGKWDNLMKSSWGWGIRFVTPVFPIRLDWGYPLQHGKGMAPNQFWFTIGQVF